MASLQKTSTKKLPGKRVANVEKAVAKEKNVKFQIAAESGSRVHVAGSFNNWDPDNNQLNEKKGIYATTLKLPVGKHEYKFIIDDNWCVDPQCEDWVPNGFGSINSVVTVK